jgi:predicted nucleic acid-binding protein
MRKSLLDTDIFSEVTKRVDQVVARRAEDYIRAHGFLTISAMTVVEVVSGLRMKRREERISEFLATLQVIDVRDLDGEVAAVAGRMYGDLERAATRVGRADPIIAATAVVHGLVLVTGNTRHFQQIRDVNWPTLELDNWRIG